MSLNVQVDLKKLYKMLCKKCQPKLIACCRVAPSEDAIKKVLMGEPEEST